MYRKDRYNNMKYSKELMSGTTPLLVLSVIKDEDMYGYKIVKELERRSDSDFVLKEGTLYPILHALEKEGYAECYWETYNGRKRKLYHITKKGIKELQKSSKEFEEFAISVRKVLNFA